MNLIVKSSATVDELYTKYVVPTGTDAERAARIAALRVAVMADVGAVIAGTPGMTSVVLTGYTPGFNDGEPCVHGMEELYLNGLSGYGDRLDQESEDDDSFVKWSDDFKKAAKILEGMGDALEEAFDTNWRITVKADESGTLTWEEEEYNCGY
jgi:hypothetical protein